MLESDYNDVDMQINKDELNHEIIAHNVNSIEKNDYQIYNGQLKKILKYWSGILNFMLIDNTVIFAPIKIDTLDQLELIDVVDKIIELNLITDLKSICYLPHKSFLYVKFGSEKSANMFQQRANNIKGRKLFYIKKETIKAPITIMIDRIPPDILRNSLPDLLSKYGSILNFKPTLIKIKDKPAIETAPVYVDIELNDSYTMENFPYHIMIDKIKVFMLVRGRKNLCYICEAKDHLASECTKKYCENCKKISQVGHDCSNSYASKLKMSLYKIGSLIDGKNKGDFPVIKKNFEEEFENFSMRNVLSTEISENNVSNFSPVNEDISIGMVENNVFIESDIEENNNSSLQITNTKDKNKIKKVKATRKKNNITPKKNGGPTKKSKRDRDILDKVYIATTIAKSPISETYLPEVDLKDKGDIYSESDFSDSVDNGTFLGDL